MRIKFDEKSHTYTHTETKEKFISVTTLLGKYKKPFDKEFHAKRVANREGVPIEMVLEMWESEKNKACDIYFLLIYIFSTDSDIESILPNSRLEQLNSN